MSIRLKSEKDLEFLRISGKILSFVLASLSKAVEAGKTLRFLDELALNLILEKGAKPAFLGYKPVGAKRAYPASICASVNDVVVHGLPSERALKKSDILKIDLGVNYRGYFTDAAITVPVGEVSKKALMLIKTTKEALNVALKECYPGKTFGDIGFAIENHVCKDGFSIIKGLTGHGVGFELHEEPTIYNYGNRGEGFKLEPGMVLAIEPMVSVGKGDIKQVADDSFVTKDGSLSAHFEHTIAITKKGVEILTI